MLFGTSMPVLLASVRMGRPLFGTVTPVGTLDVWDEDCSSC
ncbi:hypothetical protein PC116_g21124 [Phytophthora cactorum]|uniref:Uncharacterized protein n=1 Tax=Phytophthora cactorum TaxID=29920 RepID=A0A8T1B0Y8_9STRA|nr:hypothetical protein Pcac1_g24029 [Phytophthora cactorum]KAG2876270.1 hypothetical protein PC114_g24280 [Phytophthora cactorum]KAG2891985.1 hypothetical protein PC117_g24125 [Phytophthora cactorum]KAG2969917.1 hypothetical protein PC119_g23784 [Phytophthora cactorum]KAG2995498.1 hypothetical protein PC120_g21742 [Phytophthora cactorum]